MARSFSVTGFFVLVALGLLTEPEACLSQEALASTTDLLPDKTVGVQSRPRPEYDALGVRIGGLTLSPGLSLEETYDDNIYATKRSPVGDLLSIITGSLGATDQTGLLTESATSNVAANRYLHNSIEDFLDYGGTGNLGYSGISNTSLGTSAQYSRAHLSRQDPSFPTAAGSPPAFDTSGGAFAFTHAFIHGDLDLNVQYLSLDYLAAELPNNTVLSQAYRNHDEATFDLRGNVLIGPTLSSFVRVIHKEYDYGRDPTGGVLDRDSFSDTAAIGASFLVTNLMKGEIAVGVLRLRNHDLTDNDLTTLSIRSHVEFFMTQLITLTATVEKADGAANIPGSSSYITTNATIGLDYELRRNLILTGSFSQDYRVYTGINASETADQASSKARWLLNRSLSLDFGYTYSRRHSQLPLYLGEDFTDQSIDIEAELAL